MSLSLLVGDICGQHMAGFGLSALAAQLPDPAPPPNLRLDGHNQQRRVHAMQRISKHLAKLPSHLTGVYQFGVLHGFGLRAWLELMPLLNVSTADLTVWGFDSFRGMPSEEPGFMRRSHENDKNWLAGGLNVQRLLGIKEWPQLRDAIVRNIGFAPERTRLVRGFFNESLRDGPLLRDRLGLPPALLLDVDCDLYTSTKQAMSFMLDTGLLVPGTYVYYDDYSIEAWNISPKKHPYMEERLAHEELTNEYGLEWTTLSHYGKYHGPLAGVSWIRQWANTSKLIGKNLQPISLNPVFRLDACAKCPTGARQRHPPQRFGSH